MNPTLGHVFALSPVPKSMEHSLQHRTLLIILDSRICSHLRGKHLLLEQRYSTDGIIENTLWEEEGGSKTLQLISIAQMHV